MLPRFRSAIAPLSFALLLATALAAAPAWAADTTLKDIMKKMGAQVAAGDTKGLGAIFMQTKTLGKPEFSEWASLADKGKTAADKDDLASAKATCKACHDAYRSSYRTKYGSKAP